MNQYSKSCTFLICSCNKFLFPADQHSEKQFTNKISWNDRFYILPCKCRRQIQLLQTVLLLIQLGSQTQYLNFLKQCQEIYHSSPRKVIINKKIVDIYEIQGFFAGLFYQLLLSLH